MLSLLSTLSMLSMTSSRTMSFRVQPIPIYRYRLENIPTDTDIPQIPHTEPIPIYRYDTDIALRISIIPISPKYPIPHFLNVSQGTLIAIFNQQSFKNSMQQFCQKRQKKKKNITCAVTNRATITAKKTEGYKGKISLHEFSLVFP